MNRQGLLHFRSDIEGLRGLAIILVVFSHARIPGFSGGFIGVDLFFVISGYLITALLLQEICVQGSINYAQFFARRIRRLLPALIVVLMCTGLSAIVILTPVEQLEQITPGIAAVAWSSNFYFAFAEHDYFGTHANANLFLHTWSLGVEEQFYLVWPLLLMTVYLLAKCLKREALHVFGYVLAVCLVLSIIFLFLLEISEPVWAFYLMPARAWQFALGSICALCLRLKTNPVANGVFWAQLSSVWERYVLILGWIGLALIIISLLMIDGNVPYPGWRSIVPTLGAALIILSWNGATKVGIARVLSLPPFMWFGRISYSLYLWHWPVLILGFGIISFDWLHSTVILLGLAVALSWLTFSFVEYPLRFGKMSKISPRWTIWGGIAATLSTVALGVLWLGGATKWLAAPEFERYRQVRLDIPSIYAMGCDDWFHSSSVKLCSFGSEKAPRTAVLIGDSIGAQWFPAIAKIFAGEDWRVVVITKSSCPIVDEDFYYSRIGREYSECKSWRNEAIKTIQIMSPDVVFIGSDGSYGFTATQWEKGTGRILEKISQSAGKIYLIAPTQVLPFDGPECVGRQMWRGKFFPFSDGCEAMLVRSLSRDALSRVADAWDNVALLDFDHLICPERKCRAMLGNRLVYRDRKHIASSFVLSVSDEFELVVTSAGRP